MFSRLIAVLGVLVQTMRVLAVFQEPYLAEFGDSLPAMDPVIHKLEIPTHAQPILPSDPAYEAWILGNVRSG